MRTRFLLGATLAALIIPLFGTASAQDLPRRQFKAIGLIDPARVILSYAA